MTTNLAKPLSEQTPIEIDTKLAEADGRKQLAMAEYARWSKLADQARKGSYAATDRLEGYEANADHALALAAEIGETMLPLQAEYKRRGGWTRAFLVDNTGGHVHSSRRCDTCFSTTQYYWVVSLSGQTEDEIVEAAGERACTVCYPSAPVDMLKRKSRIETPARAAARIDRESKAAAKAAKQLTDPATGRIVREVILVPRGDGLRDGSEIGKTERGAELAALSGLSSLLWYGEGHPFAQAWKDTAERVAVAIAAKHGEDVEVVRDRIAAKAQKSHNRQKSNQ